MNGLEGRRVNLCAGREPFTEAFQQITQPTEADDAKRFGQDDAMTGAQRTRLLADHRVDNYRQVAVADVVEQRDTPAAGSSLEPQLMHEVAQHRVVAERR